MSDILIDGFGLEDKKKVNPRKFLQNYLRFKYLFAASILIAVALAVLHLFYAEKYYHISSKIVIKDKEKGVNFSDNLISSELDILRTSKILENEMEVFMSLSLMESVLRDLQFETMIYSKDKFLRKKEYYKDASPLLVNWSKKEWLYEPDEYEYNIEIIDGTKFKLDFDGKTSTHRFGEVIKGHYGEFNIALNESIDFQEVKELDFIVYFSDPASMAAGFVNRLEIAQANKQSSVLYVNLVDNIPQRGKEVVDRLIYNYNSLTEIEKNETANTTVNFLSDQLSSLTFEIDSIERKIELLKTQNRVSDVNSEARLYSESSNQIKNEIRNQRTQVQILESIRSYISTSTGEFRSVPSSLSIDDPSLIASVANYNTLQRDRERLLQTNEPGNPIVQGIDEKLNNQKQDILENIKNIKSSLEISIRNLESNSSQFDYKSSQIPQIERELQDLERLKNNRLEQFNFLNQKNEEALISLTVSSNTFSRVIDKARSSPGPVSPKKPITLAFAVIMGFGIPFTFIFVKNLLNNKIGEKVDAEEQVNLPVIGEISKNDTMQGMVFGNKHKSPVAEQFRLLRSNLINNSTYNSDTETLLITSSTSGEGKTFCATNLGGSFSVLGKKSVVLEFDLRKPALFKSLGLIKPEIGIIDYVLNKKLVLSDILVKDANLDNLYFIGAGNLVSSPSEIICHDRVSQLFQALREQFQYIIIDTSPVGMVPDAFELVHYADKTLYILRSEYTTTDNLDFLNQFGVKEKLKNPSLIFNGVRLVNGYGYGYDYEPVLN
ncbi:GumC family protein [Belliella marina]|uniref:GumC family protein n=1 Tax=Belliella marina TaxID=1644146 RepID=A0ABW4VNM8_9BACT